MATHTHEGCSLECKESTINVRKLSGPTMVKIDGVTYYKYKSKISASVVIKKELQPKEHRICETSVLNLDDAIEADTVEILAEKRIKLTLVSNYSNVHGMNQSSVSPYTYAKIIIPWRFVLEQNLIAS